jgi:hypothetical protein
MLVVRAPTTVAVADTAAAQRISVVRAPATVAVAETSASRVAAVTRTNDP